jgi:hypothetical protein
MNTCPSSGRKTVLRREMAVVFPAPFGPRRPKISPAPKEKLRLEMADADAPL